MRFEWSWFLAVVPVLALLVAGLARLARRRRIAAARAWSDGLAREAAGRHRRGWLLLGVVALLAGFGIAGPRAGRALVSSSTRGLNVVVGVDISRSMLAEDVAPNRLGRASREVRRLLADLPEDRIALLGFAGHSYVLSPLTIDHGAVDLYVDDLDPDVATEGGTNLAAALAQGAALLDQAGEGGDRALVLFTDGEAHEAPEETLAAARALRGVGVTLVVVAEGGLKPIRIPVRDSTGALREWQRDGDGQIILTTRSDAGLQQVAEAAGGHMVAADLPDQARAVREILEGLARRPASETRLDDLLPFAWLPALLGGVLLIVVTLRTRGRALAGLGLLILGAGRADAQRPGDAERLLLRGDTAGAGAAFRRAARDGRGGDTAWFNAGTAWLAAGRLGDARDALGRAAVSLDPGLRFRAVYNLGLAALLEARQDQARRDTLLAEAEARFRDALLLRPGSADARWNLELSLRPERPPSGASSPKPPPPKGGGRTEDPRSGMAPREADALLSSVDRAERETRQRQLNRRRHGGTGVKDW